MYWGKRAAAVGKLIMIIAIILVATIAAAVILNMGYNLDNKAIRIADRTQNFAALALSIVQINAEDGRDIEGIRDFEIKLKLSPKSQAVTLRDMLLEFDLNNQSQQYLLREINMSLGETYNCTWSSNMTESGYWTNTSNSTGYYGIEYIVKGPQYSEGYIEPGDMVKICFRAPRYLDTDEELMIMLIPKSSAAVKVELHTPNLFNTKKVYLYPSRTAG